MKASLLAAALLLVTPLAVTGVAHAKPPAARNYDCSKPGNASKAVCKTQTSSSASSSTVAAATAMKAQSYDCAKAGNANKAACKSMAAASSSSSTIAAAAPASDSKTARNYDCSKAGNKSKAVCKTVVASAPVPAANQNMPMNAQAVPAAKVAKPATAVAGAPAGATAQCKDGTWSMSQHHSGTCSHHGGVAKWLS